MSGDGDRAYTIKERGTSDRMDHGPVYHAYANVHTVSNHTHAGLDTLRLSAVAVFRGPVSISLTPRNSVVALTMAKPASVFWNRHAGPQCFNMRQGILKRRVDSLVMSGRLITGRPLVPQRVGDLARHNNGAEVTSCV